MISSYLAARHEQTFVGLSPTPWGLPEVQLVRHEREEIGRHLGYLRAQHPAIAAAASTTSTLSQHVSPRLPRLAVGPRGALLYYTFYYRARHAKGPLPDEKGLDLRKLVAGAGFEPATSGL